MAQGAIGKGNEEAEISEPAGWLHTQQALTNQSLRENDKVAAEILTAYKQTPRPCKKCGEIFSGARCTPCRRAYDLSRRQLDDYRAAEKAAADRYYQKNKERVAASVARRRASDPETFKTAARRYARNRRARKRGSGGAISKDLEARLLALQRGLCPCCGKPLKDDYHLDHIVPLALGGAHSDENMQLLRSKCNLQKHAMHPIEFMQRKGFLL